MCVYVWIYTILDIKNGWIYRICKSPKDAYATYVISKVLIPGRYIKNYQYSETEKVHDSRLKK